MPKSFPAVPLALPRLVAIFAALLLVLVPSAHAQDGGGAEAGVTGATGSTTPAPAPTGAPLTRTTIRAVQRKLKVRADGKLGPGTRAAIRRFQKRRGLKVDGRLQPDTLAALGVTGKAAAATPMANAPIPAEAKELLDGIAACESGGDPTAVSANGDHRGKYQFLTSTWEAVGGAGDPAAAPEAEQDQRAATLLSKQGTKPWPVCGPKAEAAARS